MEKKFNSSGLAYFLPQCLDRDLFLLHSHKIDNDYSYMSVLLSTLSVALPKKEILRISTSYLLKDTIYGCSHYSVMKQHKRSKKFIFYWLAILEIALRLMFFLREIEDPIIKYLRCIFGFRYRHFILL